MKSVSFEKVCTAVAFAAASVCVVLPISSGVASAKCYAVNNGAYTQWAGVARETPLAATCNGNRVYQFNFLDLNWGDGVSTRYEVRRADTFSGESFQIAYTLSEGGTSGNGPLVTINDLNDTVNMQFRICKTNGTCAQSGTNTGH